MASLTHLTPDEATIEHLRGILESDGCVVIDGLVRASELAPIQQELKRLVADARTGTRDFDGHHTRRIFDPIARTRILDDVVVDPLIADIVNAVVGPSQFGMTILTEVCPGEVRQRLHRDSSIYPLPPEFGPVQLNTIWAVDAFTTDNGATVVAPGSHLSASRASQTGESDLVAAAMDAGSVLVYDGRLVHGAGANTSSRPRLGLIVEHTVRWLRPAENHGLAMSAHVASMLRPELQEMLGFNQHSEYLGFVSGQPPRDWLHDQRPSAT